MKKHLNQTFTLLTVLVAILTACALPVTPVPSRATSAPSITATSASPALLEVPSGRTPTLDGVLSADEWTTAYSVELSDGGKLLLMQDENYLYIGLHAPTMIVGSVSVDEGHQIRVLHSSAALGTALYEKGETGWQRAQEFTWSCRDFSDSDTAQAERARHLKDEGWLATNAQASTSGEMEYQIAMPENTMRLAVAYIQIADERVFWWPQKLNDDSRNVSLIGGDPPETLQFLPEQWMTIVASR